MAWNVALRPMSHVQVVPHDEEHIVMASATTLSDETFLFFNHEQARIIRDRLTTILGEDEI